MRFPLVFATILALAGPASAAATPWQEVAPGARLRLITSDSRAADGTTTIGLELDMPDADKTYWRLPGESGIPTELDLTGSSGVASSAIDWPYPAVEQQDGFLDYVYRGHTVLPATLKTSGDALLLEAHVVMGICSDVCIPVRASFSLPLTFTAPDAGQGLRLKQAEATTPIGWAKSTPAFGRPGYDAANLALTLPSPDPAIDPASIIATTTDPTVIFGTPQKSPDGSAILLTLRSKAASADWLKSPITLTFSTDEGPYEVSEQVTAPKP